MVSIMQNILVAVSYFPFVFFMESSMDYLWNEHIMLNPCKKYIEVQPIYFLFVLSCGMCLLTLYNR